MLETDEEEGVSVILPKQKPAAADPLTVFNLSEEMEKPAPPVAGPVLNIVPPVMDAPIEADMEEEEEAPQDFTF